MRAIAAILRWTGLRHLFGKSLMPTGSRVLNVKEQGDAMDDGETEGAAAAFVEETPDLGEDPAVRLRKIVLAVTGAGAAFALLFVASMFTLAQSPVPRASDVEIAEFYAGDGPRRLVVAGLYLLPLATVAFLWFIAVLRDWEVRSARRLNRVLASVQLLSGIGFITLCYASAAASVVTAFAIEFGDVPVDASVARQFPLFGQALLYVFAMRMAAIFVTSTTGIVRSSGIFPLWFVLVSYGVAAFLFLTATINVWLVLVFPAWVLLLCGMIIYRARTLSPTDVVVSGKARAA